MHAKTKEAPNLCWGYFGFWPVCKDSMLTPLYLNSILPLIDFFWAMPSYRLDNLEYHVRKFLLITHVHNGCSMNQVKFGQNQFK